MGERVKCTVEISELDGQPSVVVVCSRCDHAAEAYGTGENSIKRALATLRDDCPEGEKNFYVNEND